MVGVGGGLGNEACFPLLFLSLSLFSLYVSLHGCVCLSLCLSVSLSVSPLSVCFVSQFVVSALFFFGGGGLFLSLSLSLSLSLLLPYLSITRIKLPLSSLIYTCIYMCVCVWVCVLCLICLCIYTLSFSLSLSLSLSLLCLPLIAQSLFSLLSLHGHLARWTSGFHVIMYLHGNQGFPSLPSKRIIYTSGFSYLLL